MSRLVSGESPSWTLMQLVHEGIAVSLLAIAGGFRVTLERGSMLVQVASPYLDDAVVRALEAWPDAGSSLEMHDVGCDALRGRQCRCSRVQWSREQSLLARHERGCAVFDAGACSCGDPRRPRVPA